MNDTGIDTNIEWRGSDKPKKIPPAPIRAKAPTQEEIDEFVSRAGGDVPVNTNDPAEQDPLQQPYDDVDRTSDKCINCKETMTPFENYHTVLTRVGHNVTMKGLNGFKCHDCGCIKLNEESHKKYIARLNLLAELSNLDGPDETFIEENDFDRMDW